MSTQDLLNRWQQRFPTLTQRDLDQARARAVSITAERTPAEITEAIAGIELIFPFSAKTEAQPWTLHDLERHFAKAVAANANQRTTEQAYPHKPVTIETPTDPPATGAEVRAAMQALRPHAPTSDPEPES